MRKEITIHFTSFLIFFLVLTLIHRWFSLPFIIVWVGGLLGTILPDADHLIYTFLLRPHELTSQRVSQMLSKGEVVRSLNLLATTRQERNHLIFHTLWFQIFFLLLTYWVLTSSGSLLGRGLVLAFSFHLVIDQFVDLAQLGNLQNWLHGSTVTLSKERAVMYALGVLIAIFVLGVVF